MSELYPQVRYQVLEHCNITGHEHCPESDHDQCVQVYERFLVSFKEFHFAQKQVDEKAED